MKFTPHERHGGLRRSKLIIIDANEAYEGIMHAAGVLTDTRAERINAMESD